MLANDAMTAPRLPTLRPGHAAISPGSRVSTNHSSHKQYNNLSTALSGLVQLVLELDRSILNGTLGRLARTTQCRYSASYHV